MLYTINISRAEHRAISFTRHTHDIEKITGAKEGMGGGGTCAERPVSKAGVTKRPSRASAKTEANSAHE